MKFVECEQGSPEWIEARLGIPTASRFKDVMTLPRSKADRDKGALSETAETYMCELVAELCIKKQRIINARALEWGAAEEPKAVADYAFTSPEPVDRVGFILRDDQLVGCSPDALVGDDGGLEIKCPENPAVHIKTLYRREMPKEHVPQVQGNMYITGRQWWDFMSYRADMPPGKDAVIIRVLRDDDYIAQLEARLNDFVSELHHRYLSIIAENPAA